MYLNTYKYHFIFSFSQNNWNGSVFIVFQSYVLRKQERRRNSRFRFLSVQRLLTVSLSREGKVVARNGNTVGKKNRSFHLYLIPVKKFTAKKLLMCFFAIEKKRIRQTLQTFLQHNLFSRFYFRLL
uniref:Uncharacterized protein n=1 Tax=Cacopsylla melanoneura TaxID=428564 RepID=A0A8D8L9Q0_9HEMI